MFQPPVFREDRPEVMRAMMRAHPFATLVSAAAGPLAADHVPLVLVEGDDGSDRLQGHLAAGNPLCRAGADETPVLAVFQGPQAYVTPGWYPSKRAHGKVVPTWNYVAVHARGRLRLVRDAAWLMRHLHALTDRHESERAQPWAVSDAPEDFVARQLRGLVGFEIAVDDLQGTWKVSQNKAPADREGVAAGFADEANPMAALVKERAVR